MLHWEKGDGCVLISGWSVGGHCGRPDLGQGAMTLLRHMDRHGGYGVVREEDEMVFVNSDLYHLLAANADRMKQAKPEEPTITATPVGHRTPAEIQRQMEQRLAEMEAEALSPKYTMPCSGCKWVKGRFCENPLIIGLEEKTSWNVDRDGGQDAALCGPEKALWRGRNNPRWEPWMTLAAMCLGGFAVLVGGSLLIGPLWAASGVIVACCVGLLLT